jgi:hypothetical protein
MVLDESKVINGSYGEVWHDGKWLSNITKCEATIDINKEDVLRAGSRWTAKKVTTLEGSGTITGYKITTEWIEAQSGVLADRGTPYVTSLTVKLDDPEAYGAMRVMLTGVIFDKIDLVKFEMGSLVEEELPFTFTGMELLDKIVAK